jgi:hypothetical protein
MNHILQGWQGDFGIYVDEYLSSIEAVPGQMNTLMSEIAEKDQETTVVLTEARANDVSLRKMIRATPTPAIPPTSFSSSFADLLDPGTLLNFNGDRSIISAADHEDANVERVTTHD